MHYHKASSSFKIRKILAKLIMICTILLFKASQTMQRCWVKYCSTCKDAIDETITLFLFVYIKLSMMLRNRTSHKLFSQKVLWYDFVSFILVDILLCFIVYSFSFFAKYKTSCVGIFLFELKAFFCTDMKNKLNKCKRIQ